ncbi:MAG: histidine kinase dimerization/phospho-acceptor domain-containing protein, partial [Actinomycetota bacterium]
MSATFVEVPLHFTIEFLGFLVAAGAALLVLTRPALVPGPPFTRVTAALGFALLAAAEVVHGGAFRLEGAFDGQFDGDHLVVSLRVLGLAFILVGVSGGIRAYGAGAVFGWELRDQLLLAPAGAALVLALVCFSASLKEGARSLRRLGFGALLLAGSEVLTAAAPRVVFGAGTSDAYAYGAHGLKALGFIAVGAWLWTGVRLSIRTRFVASFVALLVIVVLVLSTALTGVISSSVVRSELQRVGDQARSAKRSIEATEKADLIGTVNTLATLPAIQDAVRAGSVQAASDIAAGIVQSQPFADDLDFLLFMGRDGLLLGRAGIGPHPCRRCEGSRLRDEQILRIIGFAKKATSEGSFSTEGAGSVVRIDRSIATIAVQQVPPGETSRRRLGLVAGGRWVDALTINEISSAAGLKGSLIVDGTVLATQLPGKPASSDVLPRRIKNLLAYSPVVTEQDAVGSGAYYSAYTSLETAANAPVGILVLSSPASAITETRASLTRLLFLVAMGVAVVALGLAYMSGRRITRPIQMLTDTATQVREGDLSAKAPVVGSDEVGRLGETFNAMTASLARMTGDLREAAREEERLRSRIETIMQSMADGLVAVDADLKILAFNREAENLTGIDAKDALGRSVEDVLDARDAEGNPVTLPVFTLDEGSVGGVFLARRDGDPVPVAFTSAVLRGDDDIVAGGVAVVRDMTREREVERMKSEFLSNISHELRTPLTPIKGYAEILERKDIPPEKAKRFVRGILDSTTRLERIVELLVDFAAMEAGRLAPRSTPVDIGKLIEELGQQW